MYSIYHTFPGYPHNEKVYVQREFVCNIYTDGLDEAFIRTQNEFNEEYKKLNVRNTSVGDIIQDKETETCYLVMKEGYKALSKDVLGYVDPHLVINKIPGVRKLPNLKIKSPLQT